MDYLTNRTERLQNLYVFTETESTAKFVKNLKPNMIVNATGSQPLLPPIPGLHDQIDKEGSKVYSILRMIDHIQAFHQNMDGKMEILNVGDSVRARRIIEGVTEGYNLLNALRKHGYLSNLCHIVKW